MSTARRQRDPQLVDLVRVAVQDRGVEHRRQQVVRGADRVDVAGEVEVEVLHRHDLRHAAAGRAALDAEHRSERRLAQARHRSLADRAEPLREADERRRLALARLRRRHAGHADQLAVGPVRRAARSPTRSILALYRPYSSNSSGSRPSPLGDLLDRPQDRVLRDLEAALHPLLLLSPRIIVGAYVRARGVIRSGGRRRSGCASRGGRGGWWQATTRARCRSGRARATTTGRSRAPRCSRRRSRRR